MKKLMSVMGVLLALVAMSWGADVRLLSLNEGAPKGATHCVKITHADLTATGTNGTAQTITNLFAVAAKQGVECVAAVLKTPFTYSTTNGLSSVTLEVGDGTDADLFLKSMELCSHGTEVFLKYGRGDEISPTVATATLTNVIYGAGATTGNVTYVTGVTAGTPYGHKLYTTADYVDFVFTPTGTEWALADLDAGEVWIYFKVWDGAKN